jgi:hypothetical protein
MNLLQRNFQRLAALSKFAVPNTRASSGARDLHAILLFIARSEHRLHGYHR